MNLIDWIGSVAAILTTASFLPQAWHTFRTRDVSGISLSMYSLFTAGVALWLVYGILMEAWPIIIANIITTSLALMILMMKLPPDLYYTAEHLWTQEADDGIWLASLKALPVDGKANEALIALIADYFKLRKKQVHIKSGAGARIKRLLISP